MTEMRFNLETLKEYLTENENEWCGEGDWWGDVEYTDDTLITVNVYSIEEYVDSDADPNDYGVTIYELREINDGDWEQEKDSQIVGQLYFNHIKTHTEGKLFNITDVIDYQNYVYNNEDPRNPKRLLNHKEK